MRNTNLDLIRGITLISLILIIGGIIFIGGDLPRNERFGYAATASFGAYYVFCFLGEIDMPMTGFTAESDNPNHKIQRIIVFLLGVSLIIFGAYNAINNNYA